MRLLTVSAGKVHVVQMGRDVVRTGHLKGPVAEPWIVDPKGVVGDERAAHPDALYAFSRSSYAHWGGYLGVDPSKWPDGFFGENLTFDDLDEGDLRIGDVFALGEEVRLFVAGARNPCNKLTWRLSQPPTFQRVFALSGHAGAYLGVEAPGRVRPGDTLERIETDPAMPTVAEVSAILIGREAPGLDPLRRLLDFPRLSPTNRMLLGPKVDAAERAAEAVQGRWRGWRPFRVLRCAEDGTDIRSVELVAVDGEPICPAKPGQFVAVRIADGGTGSVTRSWSLSRFDEAPGSYRVTVRRQDGKGSRRFHELEVGEVVHLRPPAGDFVLNRGGFRPVVMIAAGIGITPLNAMLHAQLLRPDPPPVTMIYGARDPASAAFLGELERLDDARDDFDLTMVYSRADVAGALHGRITPELVLDRLGDVRIVVNGHAHAVPWYECDIYMCGPQSLCEGLRDALVARGGNADRIFFELFMTAEIEATEIDRATVTFARSGRTAEWNRADDPSLLELAESAGVEIPSSCRAGTCLTCLSSLIGGGATSAMPDGGFLPCVARPTTPELTIDA